MVLNKREFLKISIFSLIILSLLVLWLAFGERGLIHLYRMGKERQSYTNKIHRLEDANRELMEEIRKLQNDQEYIEAMARKELGMIKENEVIFRFRRNHDHEKMAVNEP